MSSDTPRQFQLLLQCLFRLLHKRTDVTSADVRLDDGAQHPVLALDFSGSVHHPNIGDAAKEHGVPAAPP